MIENGYVFKTNGGSYAKVIKFTNSKNILIEFQDIYQALKNWEVSKYD